MKDNKTDRIIFRLPEQDGEQFRRLAAAKGGASAVLRRFIKRYVQRHSRAA